MKREMAKLRALGWLVQKRAAVRGRVAIHGLDLAAILTATRPDWAAVGPDFVERRTGPQAAPAPQPGNVVAFPVAPLASLPEGAPLWDRAQAVRQVEDPANHAQWFRQLAETGFSGGCLDLAAPSRFHAAFVTTHHLVRLLAVVRRVDGTVRSSKISAE